MYFHKEYIIDGTLYTNNIDEFLEEKRLKSKNLVTRRHLMQIDILLQLINYWW
jgi:hypothetical protein